VTGPDTRTPQGHVLVVDDEPQLLRAVELGLRGRGYEVTAAATGAAAVRLTAMNRPDLLVLDLGLPDISGLEVIRRIRQGGDDVPIVVLSARTATTEKVAALDLGATDYVTKPFDMEEFVARLRAARRRGPAAQGGSAVVLGAVTVDLAAKLVSRNHAGPEETSTVQLTPTEWRMLEVLLRHPGRLITPGRLLAAMRDGDHEHAAASYLRTYLQQLRRKLELDPSRPRYLLTEPGLGYRYRP
jgi:two-component system KDP operon response regulator KdpE